MKITINNGPIVLILVWFACLSPVHGQATSSSITGTALDSTGAVIAGVTVVVTNQQTNQAKTIGTDDHGNYELTDLGPSTYTVTGQRQGFKKFEARNIVLDAQQTLRIDITLQPGSVSTDITVVSGTPVVESETPTIAATLGSQQLLDTSTNLRSVADAYGDSGVFNFISYSVPTGYESGGFRFSLGGARGGEFNFTVDGISSNAPGFGNAYGTLQPSFESTQEVRYEFVNNKAELDQVANVTTVTKSGTNEFHGGLFWFNTNNAYAARNFFATNLGQNILNDFGGFVGGPIKRNKLFFFFNYEGDRQRTPAVISPSVPTEQMRSGDFSQLLDQSSPVVIVNPSTGTSFPNNVIPQSILSQAALTWQKMFEPLPNFGSPTLYVGNFRGTYPQDVSHNEYFGRADYIIAPDNTLYARYYYKLSLPGLLNGLLPPSITGYNQQRRTSQQTAISDTWSFGANMVNEFKFGFARDLNVGGGILNGEQIVNDLGIQGVPPAPANAKNIPQLSISDFSPVSPQSSFSYAANTFQYIDQLTYVRGAHTIKAGIEFRPMQFDALNYPTFGAYTFSGGLTNFSYADFLLGLPQSTTLTHVGPSEYARLWYLMGFLQDDWKVSRRLTLSFGLRYDYDGPARDKYDAFANFDPSTGSLVVPTSQVLQRYLPPFFPSTVPIETAQQAGFPTHSLRDDYTEAFQPRFGFAFRPFSKASTVLRGGYGIFNDELNADITSLLYGAPFNLTEGFTNQIVAGQPLLTLTNPFVGQPNVGAVVVNALGKNVRNPYAQQWSLTFEQDIGFNIGLRVSYIGLKCTDLLYGRDINQVPASTMPYSASRRPYPAYQSIFMYSNGGNQNYNALSVEVNRRWSKGLAFQAAWTWAKSLTDDDETGDVEAGVVSEDSYNLSRDYGNSQYAPRHAVQTNLLWELPFGPGKPFANHGGLIDRVVGGWQLTTGLVAQTGQYLTPTFSGPDPSNTLTFSGRPNVVGNWRVPSGQRSVNKWFNASAFTVPSAGQFGNAGRGIIEGPGLVDLNAGLFKSLKVTEHSAFRFQASFTNVLNHANLGNPNLNISVPASAGVITSTYGQSFGITGGPRQGQLGVRYNF